MVHPLMKFERFEEALESLKGTFQTYSLDDEWVDRFLRTLPKSPN